jgi:hypothetical protein
MRNKYIVKIFVLTCLMQMSYQNAYAIENINCPSADDFKKMIQKSDGIVQNTTTKSYSIWALDFFTTSNIWGLAISDISASSEDDAMAKMKDALSTLLSTSKTAVYLGRIPVPPVFPARAIPIPENTSVYSCSYSIANGYKVYMYTLSVDK